MALLLDNKRCINVHPLVGGQLDYLAVLGLQQLPHGVEQTNVGWVPVTIEGLDKGITACSRITSTRNICICTCLAVLASSNHNNFSLDGAEKEGNIYQPLSFISAVF